MSSSLLYIQAAVLVAGISLNGFSIHCLKQQKAGNTHSWLLLQNLAAVEIVKAVYDFIALSAYNKHNAWYRHHLVCFNVLEVTFMTIFFLSLIFIALDKMLVLLLHGKYTHRVTRKIVKWSICCAWMSGLVIGSFLRKKTRLIWYLAADFVVVLLNVVVILLYRRWVRTRDGRFPQINTRRCTAVSLLLLTSFTVLYALPDCVFACHPSHGVFVTVQFFWTAGYVIDPLIYTFTYTKVKNTALSRLCGTFKYTNYATGTRRVQLTYRDREQMEKVHEKDSSADDSSSGNEGVGDEEVNNHFVVDIFNEMDELMTEVQPRFRRKTISSFGDSSRLKVNNIQGFKRLVSKPGA